jgi:cysteine desulfurase
LSNYTQTFAMGFGTLVATYLDCNATTPPDRRVVALIKSIFEKEYGNAGSRTHVFGTTALKFVNHAREQVAGVVDVDPSAVIFTSGATESNNIAILGLSAFANAQRRRHFITTQIEHKAVLEPMEYLRSMGFDVTFVAPTRGGWVDANEILSAVRPDTLLISVMHVNNETGVVQPVAEIADRLKDRNVYFHTDAAQGFGKDLTQLRHPRIDLVSISGHKIYGPQGIGALIMRRREHKRPPLEPLQFGGAQERGLRPGTMPVALIAGLGLAAELAQNDYQARNDAAKRIRGSLLAAVAPFKPQINGDPERTLPTTLNLSFAGLDSEAVILALKDVVAISNGSACTSAGHQPSHVLKAMQLDEASIRSATRWSWYHDTPEPEWSVMRNALMRIL